MQVRELIVVLVSYRTH